MVIDTDNVDHFTTYTHIKSFCCIPETNVICQLYPNFNKYSIWDDFCLYIRFALV